MSKRTIEQFKEEVKSIDSNFEVLSEYCKKNNINLIRIPYTEKDSIKDVLEKILDRKI